MQIFLLLLISAIAQAAPGLYSEVPKRMAASTAEGIRCLWDEAFLQCFRSETNEPISSPTLKSVSHLEFRGGRRACALSDGNLHCWRWREDGSLVESDRLFEEFTSFSFFSGRDENYPNAWEVGCYIRRGKVHCFSDAAGEELEIDFGRQFRDPKKVIVEKHRACVLDTDGIYCFPWNEEYRKPFFVPSLKNPRDFTIFEKEAGCAADDEGIKCWESDQEKFDGKPYSINIVPETQGALNVGSDGYCRYSLHEDNSIRIWTDKSRTKPRDLYLHRYTKEGHMEFVNGTLVWFLEGKYRSFSCNRYPGEYGEVGLAFMGLNFQLDPPNVRSALISDYGAGRCLLSDNGAYCGHTNYKYEEFLTPPEKAPVLVSPKGLQQIPPSCQWRDGDLYCHEKLRVEGLVPPISGKASALALAGTHGCTLIGKRAECWSGLGHFPISGPPLKSPSAVAASGDGVACALEQDGARCWNYLTERPSDIRFWPMKNPRALKMRGDIACALHEEGLLCWRGAFELGRIPLSPEAYALGVENEICVADEGKIHCWEKLLIGSPRSTPLPPETLVAGEAKPAGTLLADRKGYLSLTGARVLESRRPLETSHFYLDQLDLFLGKLRRLSPKRTAELYRRLEEIYARELAALDFSRESSEARYLLLGFLAPTLEGADSARMKEENAYFQASRKKIEVSLGLAGIAQVADSPMARRVALGALRSALQVAQKFLGANENVPMALRALGEAQADPMSATRIAALVAAVEAIQPKLQGLDPAKTGYLNLTILLGLEWLKAKAGI